MKPKFFQSLSFNLISWYVFLFLLMILLISWSVIKIVEHEVLTENIKNFQIITETTGNYLEQSFSKKPGNLDIETLISWITKPMKKRGILLGIEVFYSYEPIYQNGNFSFLEKEIKEFIGNNEEEVSYKINMNIHSFTTSRYHYVDLFWLGKRNIQVAMRFSLRWFNFVTGRIFKILLVYIITTTVVIIFILLWITEKKVISPIRSLTDASEKVARGDFLSKKPYSSGDEIGFLANSMFFMSNKIKEDRETIVNQIKELNEAYKKLKEMQEEIIRNEKMALVGQMTSGLAHEIGNPITSIIGLSQILLQTGNLTKEDRDLVERIMSEGKRIDTLIKTLLNFSRPKKEEMKEVKITKLIKNAVDILRIQGKLKNIEVTISGNEEMICVQEEKLLQVLINLILNASDAIREKFGRSEGGKINIETKTEDEAVKIIIEDNGIGIDEENIKKIFLPFFTTKEPGKGTGLGLYVSSLIIDQLGGKISVESSSMVGTKFIIKLLKNKNLC